MLFFCVHFQDKDRCFQMTLTLRTRSTKNGPWQQIAAFFETGLCPHSPLKAALSNLSLLRVCYNNNVVANVQHFYYFNINIKSIFQYSASAMMGGFLHYGKSMDPLTSSNVAYESLFMRVHSSQHSHLCFAHVLHTHVLVFFHDVQALKQLKRACVTPLISIVARTE